MDPLCSYFGRCGGCSSQHIPYSVQLDNKKKSLSRVLKFDDVKVFSDSEFFYRNRMDLVFHKNGVGFRKKDSWHEVVDIEKCVISNDSLNFLISEVRSFFKDVDYFDLKEKTGTFRFAVVRSTGLSSSISFVLNEDSTRLSAAVDLIKEFSSVSSADSIIVTYVNTESSVSDNFFVVKGSDMLKEKFLGFEFLFSVQGFFQNNSIMANKMLEYSNSLLKNYDCSKVHLLDLYGGVGTFGIINSSLFSGVTIVEAVKSCIDAANLNIKNNNIKNAKAVVLDAKYISRLNLPKPLFVITDPPRSGMDMKTIQQLITLRPEVIIYVSCNIEQLGKDLLKFKRYKIKSAALFDLFPQTNHCEAVVELVLSEP